MYINLDYITTYITILGAILAFMSILITFKMKKRVDKTYYESDRKHVILDDYRMYYETKIIELERQLLNSQDKWLNANHLLVEQQEKIANNSIDNSVPNNSFINNHKLTSDVVEENDYVFLLTPFNPQFEDVSLHIKQICNSVGLRCERGDEHNRPNDILTHIIDSILRSKVIIANVDGRNPNVYYELGICHALGKNVIIIASSQENLPFDIKSKNIIFYDDFNSLDSKLTKELLKIYK